jgi:hypothetical protein
MKEKEEPQIDTLGAATETQAEAWNAMVLQYVVSVKTLVIGAAYLPLQHYKLNVKSWSSTIACVVHMHGLLQIPRI